MKTQVEDANGKVKKSTLRSLGTGLGVSLVLLGLLTVGFLVLAYVFEYPALFLGAAAFLLAALALKRRR